MKKRVNAVLIVIIFLGTIARIYLGFQKEYFHMDEAYSYGLMNYNKLSIVDNEDFLNKWHTKEYYLDYLEINKNEIFNLKPIWENQKNDVHPPFYYLLLRIMASFTIDNFTKWTGILLNIIFFGISTVFVYLISKELFQNPYYSLAVSFINTFSGIALNSALYIRMYELCNLNILVITYLHIKLYKNKNASLKDYFKLLPVLLIGGLTHYYYFIYVLGVYLVYSILCIKNKRFEDLKKYNIICIVSAFAYILIWPYAIKHILYGTRGIKENTSIFISYIKFVIFVWIANKEFYYYLLPIFIILIIGISKSKTQKTFKANNSSIKFLIYPTIIYFIVISKNAPYLENRYLIPIYSITIISSIYYIKVYLNKFWSNKDTLFIEAFLFLIMCYLPLVSKIDFEYSYSKYNHIAQKVENENLPIIYVFNTQNNRFLDDIYLFTLSPKSVIIKYEDLTEENLEKIIENEKKFFLICNEGVEKEKFKNLYTKLEYLQKLNAAEMYKIEV